MGRRPKAMLRDDYVPSLSEVLKVDQHVGQRVRLRRKMLGMSQSVLGESLGIAFQQVQKYERGINKISVSTLYNLSKILDVNIVYFFEDLPVPFDEEVTQAPGFAEYSEARNALENPELMRLVSQFERLTDRKLRQLIIHIVQTLAEDKILGSEENIHEIELEAISGSGLP
jgi:transcriptional regulator with XRE-family HTH domain